MGVRSTTATASLALLLCVTLTSCTADEAPEREADAALLELERAADALSATVLRPGAERAFARKGHPVEGSLDCTPASGAEPPASPSADPPEEPAGNEEESLTAGGPEGTADGEDRRARGGRLDVLCTGQSRDGEDLRFEGRLLREALADRAEGDDSLRGVFTGLVGEDEVFTMDCLQCSPANAEPSEAPGSPDGGEAAESDGAPAEAD